MKLYFSPGACSLSPHIALREAGLAFELEQVDLATKRTKGGADYKAINPNGYVPALQFDDGSVLTEGPAIVQWIADRKPEAKLALPAGTMERHRLQEWLNFVGSELHKSLGAFFNPKLPEAWKEVLLSKLEARFGVLSDHLGGRSYLMGETFTVADGYLFTVLGWTKPLKVDLGKWPTIAAYVERVGQRPAVQAALKAEGLAE